MKLGKRQRAAMEIANRDGCVVAGSGEDADVPWEVCKALAKKGLLAAAPPPFSQYFIPTAEGEKVT